MLHIITLKPTVGTAKTALVSVSEKNEAEFHSILTSYVKDVYGEYTAIQYVEQFALAAVMVNRKIDLFINADEMIENKLL